MTNQQAFDKVVKHLLTQMRLSVNNGSCLYYGPSGTRCAVGCLIPEEEYTRDIEGQPIRNIQEKVHALEGIDTDLLMNLQDVHDSCFPVEWERELRYVANEHHLTFPENIND